MGRNNKTIFDGSLVNRINDISRSFETNIGKNNLICKILTFVQKNLRDFYHYFNYKYFDWKIKMDLIKSLQYKKTFLNVQIVQMLHRIF